MSLLRAQRREEKRGDATHHADRCICMFFCLCSSRGTLQSQWCDWQSPGALLQCLLSTTQSNLASNFERRVLDDDHVWIVHFTSLNNELCENCTKFLPYWQTLSKSLKRCVTGIVNVASRDGHELAEKLNIVPSSLPQVRIFNTMTSDVSPNGDAFGIPVITQQVADGKARPACY